MGTLLNQHDFSNTILAQGKRLSLDTWETGLNNNIMLVGSTGRGKTRHFIKPNIMQMNSNLVISDPKGLLILELGDLLEQNGYLIKVLNLVDMAHSNTYNPFFYFKDASDVYKAIDFLMLNVNQGSMNASDPFWDQSAKMLIAAICFWIMSECNPEDQHFGSVLKLLCCHEVAPEGAPQKASTLDVLMQDLAEREPFHLAVKQYKMFKSSAGSPRTAASIVATAMTYLQYFNMPEYCNLTASNNIEFEKLSSEKMALFVITSDTDRSKNWLAGVFYSQLFDELCRNENKYHIRFILDDFVCTGKIPDFDYKMAMIRSRNLSCIVTIQDEAQLLKEYGAAAQGIISNCDSYVFLGSSNIDICDTVAHRLGDYNITGTDIRMMDPKNCVVICGNGGGILRKYDLKKHPLYNAIAEDEKSSVFYNLSQKHIVPISDAETLASRTRKSGVSLKDSIFDSFEEDYLYSIIKQISGLNIAIHQHLRDVFITSEIPFSKKLSYMHCDFIVRDQNMKVLFGIEIDGSHHQLDPIQFGNDRLKDSFFDANGIPLLRFSAGEVRDQPYSVLDEIIKTASLLDTQEHSFSGSIPKYRAAQEQERPHLHRIIRKPIQADAYPELRPEDLEAYQMAICEAYPFDAGSTGAAGA